MAKAYSYDLRRKVIEAIELDGMKRTEASQHFRISRNTINLWLQRQAATGDYQAKAGEHKGHSHKITDWDKFRAFATEHYDKTQSELAERWDDDISARTISRALKKLGWTRKKRATATRSETSKSAQPSSGS